MSTFPSKNIYTFSKNIYTLHWNVNIVVCSTLRTYNGLSLILQSFVALQFIWEVRGDCCMGQAKQLVEKFYFNDESQ